MLRTILVLLAAGAIAAAWVWYAPEGLLKQVLQFAVGIDLLIVLFAISIAVFRWLAPANPDGTPAE